MSKPLFSIVINCDNRQGYLNDSSKVGEFSNDPLNGTRSLDFLTEGLRNKISFFRGYDTQCIAYIDKHSEIESGVIKEIEDIVYACGNNSKLIFKEHNRTRYRWYDYITLEALKLAEGDYICHFDNDSNAFRSDESDIIEKYLKWLDEGYRFVCSPVSPLHKEKWYWATTQFFICKKETIDVAEIEKCFDNRYLQSKYGRMEHNPTPCCAEHTIGLMGKEGDILYPTQENDSYIIFCWWEYKKGLLKKLNEMPYKEVFEFIKNSGLTQTSW